MKRILLAITVIFLFVLWGCTVTDIGQEEMNVPTVKSEPTMQIERSVPTEPTTAPTVPTEAETVPQQDPAEQILGQMTLEEKVGQLFLVACPDSDAVEAIEKYHFGGLILFGKDIEGHTPDSLTEILAQYQQISATPMLIAVDEEGGTVCRISGEKAFRDSRFYSPGYLMEQGGLELLLQMETEKCNLLKNLGVNVNLAPVCDIATDPDAFMYHRSLRLSPEETASTIQSIVVLMDQMRVGNVLKHFPGYGNNTDTHVAMALDKRDLETLEKEDLLPFQAGITVGADAIMISHTVVSALDSQMPASLSGSVHNYLREVMGFDGVIVTDDLKMAAISDAFGDEEAAVLAVLAGNDMLCLWEYEAQYAAVLEAVQSGKITNAQLEQAVLRILRWKQELGILDTTG